MPKPETWLAAKECFDAFAKLFQVVGPWWMFAYCLLTIAVVVGVVVWRSKQADKAWERAIAAKDAMIDLINEQNRELRVQAFVVGGVFTKEEAVRLVYKDNRLDSKDNDPSPEAK